MKIKKKKGIKIQIWKKMGSITIINLKEDLKSFKKYRNKEKILWIVI